MYNCPECNKELLWITDQRDDEIISYEYECDDCNIQLVKYIKLK
jgi:DNA-directed RNA polymerase subunit RPC12/RpoP